MDNSLSLQQRSQRHIERMDVVVRAAEIKWGLLGGLEQRVPPELAEKFQAQWDNLSQAIMAGDHAEIITHADGVMRGVWALESRAILDGHLPLALSPIGLGVAVMASNDVVGEYVPSGKPMDEPLGF